MTTDIRIDHARKRIEGSVTGELHTERSLRLVRELAVAVILHKGYHVLMDLRDTTTDPAMLDLMAIASACAQLKPAWDIRIAFLIPDGEDRVRFARLFKSCMESQGIDFRQFFDADAARAWISG